MRIKARAKINWTLDIVGKREDGYHLLDSLIQSVELYDTLTIRPADTLEFVLEGYARVPDDDNNLALRAARLLIETAQVKAGANLSLKKRIPVGAGMGGGSADAAAVLMGLNRFWRLNLPEEQLRALGLAIGADVPFCMSGGLQRMT
nr:4-(cytidine 5'-diphospho)-2-C-methyl-D-erythritol kinase [Clostridia bacterium]